jgi:hypothetical protein
VRKMNEPFLMSETKVWFGYYDNYYLIMPKILCSKTKKLILLILTHVIQISNKKIK